MVHSGTPVCRTESWKACREARGACQSSAVCSVESLLLGLAYHSRKCRVIMAWTSPGVHATLPAISLITSKFRVCMCLRPPSTPRIDLSTVFILFSFLMCSRKATLSLMSFRRSVRCRPCMRDLRTPEMASHSAVVGVRVRLCHQPGPHSTVA